MNFFYHGFLVSILGSCALIHPFEVENQQTMEKRQAKKKATVELFTALAKSVHFIRYSESNVQQARDAVDAALKAGAEVNAVGIWNRIPVIPGAAAFIVFEMGPVKSIRAALDEDVNAGCFYEVNAVGIWNRIPLVFAAAFGDPGIVERLLRAGADIHIQDDQALKFAIKYSGSLAIITMLLDHGAAVNNGENDGTPLDEAISKDSVAIVQLLIQHGAKVQVFDKFGRTPLMKASVKGYAKMMDLLINAGAPLDDKDKDGCTALMLVIKHSGSPRSLAIIAMLLDLGAEVNNVANDGTPLDEAISKDSVAIVEQLIKHDAKVQVFDKFGRTPLMKASIKGNAEIMDLLIKANAPRDDKDKDGFTALMFAVIHDKRVARQLLVQAGADTTIKNNEGKTADELVRIKLEESDIVPYSIT